MLRFIALLLGPGDAIPMAFFAIAASAVGDCRRYSV